MKCPQCGKETAAEKTCGHCGKALSAVPGVEVQYRDFKVSELLDIKMPGQASSAAGEEREGTAARTVEEAPPSGKSKVSRLALAAIILLLAAAAGFILLKLLTKF